MQRYKLLPCRVDFFSFGKQVKRTFNAGCNPFHLSGEQSQSVPRNRTSGNCPALDDVLRHDAYAMALRRKVPWGGSGFFVLRVVAIDAANEDVRIC
jgi:hypothetical protein